VGFGKNSRIWLPCGPRVTTTEVPSTLPVAKHSLKLADVDGLIPGVRPEPFTVRDGINVNGLGPGLSIEHAAKCKVAIIGMVQGMVHHC